MANLRTNEVYDFIEWLEDYGRLNVDFKPENKANVLEILKREFEEDFDLIVEKEDFAGIDFYNKEVTPDTPVIVELKQVAENITFSEYCCVDDNCFSWSKSDEELEANENEIKK